LLEFVDDVLDDLGSRHAIQHVHQMMETGTGADRQLAVFNETNSLVSVADYIHSQFLK
jgi:carboxylate-amine ligase